jgi:hypothetical protein
VIRYKWYKFALVVVFVLSSSVATFAADLDPNEVVFKLAEPEYGVQAGTLVSEVALQISSPSAFQGFSASLAYDPDVFDILGHNDRDTIVESLGGADFIHFKIDDEVGFITIGVLLRTTPPFDVTIPGAGFPMTMMNIEVTVPDDVPSQVSRFRFVNGFGRPPTFNYIVHDNISERPDRQKDALISILGAAPFIRGDVSQDGKVDMTDPINLLKIVILGEGEIECEKSADTNDTAHVDFSDGIYLLQFLFLGASSPPAPFPEPGYDNRPEYSHLHCATSFFSSR